MTRSIGLRTLILGLFCLLMAGCTQSSVSTYDGAAPVSDRDARQRAERLEAARERARKAREARRRDRDRRRKERAEERRERLRARKAQRRERRAARANGQDKKNGKKGERQQLALRTDGPRTRRNEASSKVVNRAPLRKRRSRTAAASAGKAKTRQKLASVRRKPAAKVTRKAIARKTYGIALNAPWKCVPGRLKSVIGEISRRYGRVVVNSTFRSQRRNRMVGGKRRSFHLNCRAVDFRVYGNTRGLTAWLARHPKVGGYKRYRGGFYHIDNGPRRTW